MRTRNGRGHNLGGLESEEDSEPEYFSDSARRDFMLNQIFSSFSDPEPDIATEDDEHDRRNGCLGSVVCVVGGGRGGGGERGRQSSPVRTRSFSDGEAEDEWSAVARRLREREMQAAWLERGERRRGRRRRRRTSGDSSRRTSEANGVRVDDESQNLGGGGVLSDFSDEGEEPSQNSMPISPLPHPLQPLIPEAPAVAEGDTSERTEVHVSSLANSSALPQSPPVHLNQHQDQQESQRLNQGSNQYQIRQQQQQNLGIESSPPPSSPPPPPLLPQTSLHSLPPPHHDYHNHHHQEPQSLTSHHGETNDVRISPIAQNPVCGMRRRWLICGASAPMSPERYSSSLPRSVSTLNNSSQHNRISPPQPLPPSSSPLSIPPQRPEIMRLGQGQGLSAVAGIGGGRGRGGSGGLPGGFSVLPPGQAPSPTRIVMMGSRAVVAAHMRAAVASHSNVSSVLSGGMTPSDLAQRNRLGGSGTLLASDRAGIAFSEMSIESTARTGASGRVREVEGPLGEDRNGEVREMRNGGLELGSRNAADLEERLGEEGRGWRGGSWGDGGEEDGGGLDGRAGEFFQGERMWGREGSEGNGYDLSFDIMLHRDNFIPAAATSASEQEGSLLVHTGEGDQSDSHVVSHGREGGAVQRLVVESMESERGISAEGNMDSDTISEQMRRGLEGEEHDQRRFQSFDGLNGTASLNRTRLRSRGGMTSGSISSPDGRSLRSASGERRRAIAGVPQVVIDAAIERALWGGGTSAASLVRSSSAESSRPRGLRATSPVIPPFPRPIAGVVAARMASISGSLRGFKPGGGDRMKDKFMSSSEDGDDEPLESLCCICMDRYKRAAFVPCGHILCKKCAKEVVNARGKCPFCNRKIKDILKLF